MVEVNREEIQNCVNALKQSGNWIGLPFDLEWQDMWDKLPQLKSLYRSTVLRQDVEPGAATSATTASTSSKPVAASEPPAPAAPPRPVAAAAPQEPAQAAPQDNSKVMAAAMKNMMRS